jgi:hypothetical protein
MPISDLRPFVAKRGRTPALARKPKYDEVGPLTRGLKPSSLATIEERCLLIAQLCVQRAKY